MSCQVHKLAEEASDPNMLMTYLKNNTIDTFLKISAQFQPYELQKNTGNKHTYKLHHF